MPELRADAHDTVLLVGQPTGAQRVGRWSGGLDMVHTQLTLTGMSVGSQASFSDGPVNVRLSIRISDGNACVENATGAATRNISANGVLLSEIVPTPGSGTEPGLAFTVDARGRVTP